MLCPSSLPAAAGRRLLSSYRRLVVRSLAADPPAALASLPALESQDPPDPAGLPEDAVVVRVVNCAVHWVDVLMMAGQYQQAPPLPYTPGMEYSGTVVSAPAGSGLETGQAVYVADMVHAGPRSYGQYQKFGGMASYTAAPVRAVSRVPEGLSMAQAATLNGAYETAYHALVHCGQVQKGEVALVHGATGATGLAAVQLCSALGVDTVVTGGSEEKLEVVRQQALGQGRVLAAHNYRTATQGDLARMVKGLGGRGVDLVYDTVGGLQLGRESLKCLKFGGRYCIVGWTSTPMAGGGRGAGADHATANTLPTNLIMMKGAKVLGCPVAIHTNLDPSIRAPRMETIQRLVADGLIRPHVSHTFPLAQAAAALAAKWDRKVVGGAVLDCT